ncbi:MAG TPA: aspartate kinase [Bryobacteraceae bacterium]|nr:aspartate kinase [Bryobacteraceae bacterium]
MSGLLVMKFGGTSMGSAERIKQAASICADAGSKRPLVVVVSAMSKITDLLLDTLRAAEMGRSVDVETNLKQLEQRHVETCRSLLTSTACSAAICEVGILVGEFQRIAHGMLMLGERPPRSVDEAIATGERLASMMIAAHLTCHGIASEAVNAAEVIVTDTDFGNANPLMDETREKARARLLPVLERGAIPIVTGFNGATEDGRPTTLGRGGSDFSASILASVLDAEELWIWSDVDGIMTADPRLVPDAAVLDEVTYNEAAELAYNGAKVLHPRTLAPLVEKGIPVWSKNSFNLEAAGTRIVPMAAKAIPGPRAVTSMANVALVSVDLAKPAVNGTAIMGRALDALAAAGSEVLAFSSSSYRQNFCFLIRKDELAPALEQLEGEFALELEHDYLQPIKVDPEVGLLAVVGEGMQGTPGLAGRIFTAISRENVNIIAIAQGSSELTIVIVVARSGLDRAVKAVHAECGLGQMAHASRSIADSLVPGRL